MADGVGFEPTKDLRPCRISSPVHSTTLPPILMVAGFGSGRSLHSLNLPESRKLAFASGNALPRVSCKSGAFDHSATHPNRAELRFPGLNPACGSRILATHGAQVAAASRNRWAFLLL